MNLPEDKKKDRKHSHEQTLPLWAIALCVTSLVVSLSSALFSAFLYRNNPYQIDNYIQAHKSELKGDKGDTGPMGPQGFTGATGTAGRNGVNSYSPTYCSTYNYSYGGSSISCY